MTSKVVDRHGREFRDGQLARYRDAAPFVVKMRRIDGTPPHYELAEYSWGYSGECGAGPDDFEILAANWSGHAPETFDPPRDSKGRPVCVGDVVSDGCGRTAMVAACRLNAVECDTGGDHMPWTDAARLTILGFAGEDRDVGAEVDGWTLRDGYERTYDHPTGASVSANGLNQWLWRRHSGQYMNHAPSLEEAQRLALGQPTKLADLVAERRAETEPREVIARDADGKELRAGNVIAGTLESEWRAVLVSEKRARALCQMNHIAPGSEFGVAPYLWRFVADGVADMPPAPRDTLPSPAPAIVAETEQARRVRQYAEFRTAVDAACPVGCVLVTDPGCSSGYGIDIFLTREKLTAERKFGWDRVDRCTGEVIQWIEQTVEEWDRETGERVRRGG